MNAVMTFHTKAPAAARTMAVLAKDLRPTCAVRLIDRRTGLTHRINGSPLMIFTKTPEEAVRELLSNRDATVWEARVEPLEARVRMGARA